MATSGGKKYLLLPLVLYPDGLMSKDTLFLNPALAKVTCFCLFQELLNVRTHTHTDIESYAIWTFVAFKKEAVWSYVEWGTVGSL